MEAEGATSAAPAATAAALVVTRFVGRRESLACRRCVDASGLWECVDNRWWTTGRRSLSGSTTATVGTRDVGCELSSATLGKESGKETEAEWSSSAVNGGVAGDHFRDRLLPPLFIE